MANKAYKFRIYPDDVQKVLFARTFGCVRMVYNHWLARKIWQDGRPFHRPYAIRLNLALPHVLVKEAFDRMDKYVFNAK